MTKLTFLGDIMCKLEMIEAYKSKEGYDFNEIFERIKEYFKESGLLIGNLDTPISKEKGRLTNNPIIRYCYYNRNIFTRIYNIINFNIKILE